jgi:hypothetical protein
MDQVVKSTLQGIRKPSGFWKDHLNRLVILKELEKKFNIQKPTDWYNYRTEDIRKEGIRLPDDCPSLSKLVQSLYPDVEWDVTR